MNKLLTSALVATLITLSAGLAHAGEPVKPTSFDASVYVTKANKIRLAVEKTTAEPLTVSLQQATSRTPLFTQQVRARQNKIAYLLDVDQLPDGAYELIIKSASGTITKQVNVSAPAVLVSQRQLAID